jgi:hypothetical protein
MDNLKILIRLMKSKGVIFTSGLTAEEIVAVEHKFYICFPPDLKEFLQTELPVSESFVNWRLGLCLKDEENKIMRRLNRPLEGMLFDINENEFWIKDWGEKPDDFEQQSKIASENFKKYPKLIPIYSHRYIPSMPLEAGNPIFSVYQMDIVYYGYNLSDYFAHEFGFVLPKMFNVPKEYKQIDFWSGCDD